MCLHTIAKFGVSSCINKEISSDTTVAIRLGNDPRAGHLYWHMFYSVLQVRVTLLSHHFLSTSRTSPPVTTLSFEWARTLTKSNLLRGQIGGWIRRIRTDVVSCNLRQDKGRVHLYGSRVKNVIKYQMSTMKVFFYLDTILKDTIAFLYYIFLLPCYTTKRYDDNCSL